MTAGGDAVRAWSKTIHGLKGDRHEWATQCADLLDEYGPDIILPFFPSRLRHTQLSRDETLRRVYFGAGKDVS